MGLKQETSDQFTGLTQELVNRDPRLGIALQSADNFLRQSHVLELLTIYTAAELIQCAQKLQDTVLDALDSSAEKTRQFSGDAIFATHTLFKFPNIGRIALFMRHGAQKTQEASKIRMMQLPQNREDPLTDAIN
jgi:hypothetical protein